MMGRHSTDDDGAPARAGAFLRSRTFVALGVGLLIGSLVAGGAVYAATAGDTIGCAPGEVIIVRAGGTWTCEPAPPTPVPSGSVTPTPSPTQSASPSAPPSATPSPTVAPTTTTAPPSPTPSPTGPPSLLTNCFTQLAACGYPTLQTTGVASGVTLTPFVGVLFARTAGQMIQDMDITGCIEVEAPGVVIVNTRVRVPTSGCLDGIRTYGAKGGVTTIVQVEITCATAHGSSLSGPNFKAKKVELRGCENGSEINGGSSIEDSWIEGSEVGNPDGHGDGVQSQGGNNVVLRHNTMLQVNPMTSAIITNPTKNNGWIVEDNFMGGGAYTFYLPEQGTNFVVRNNRFVPAKTGALYSAAFGLTDGCSAGITWSGNYKDSDLSPVSCV